ncbi:MAG: sigma-E factor negative regulatory protein [Pseudomonadota bacterium]|nr:sigma-E factor negative regulatory protein [Pseudomonadota bacterium]
MSEQILEQVSAFLDGELPNAETELLLKRLTRDVPLRESFGRYALIGEAMRGTGPHILTGGFVSRVNLAIDGEPAHVAAHASQQARAYRWWRPLAGVTVAAGVATVAIVALQQRAISPGLPRASAVTAQSNPVSPNRVAAQNVSLQGGGGAREALSYTVPGSPADAPLAVAPARLTNYVFAHSKYSSGLGQRSVLADLLIEDDGSQLPPIQRVAQPALTPDVRVVP